MDRHFCIGGRESAEPSWWEHDGQGIPLCRVCHKCRNKKLAPVEAEGDT